MSYVPPPPPPPPPYVPPQPNPYLPGADGVAPGNGYDYRPQGVAKQAAATIAFHAVRKYGPAVIKKVLFRR